MKIDSNIEEAEFTITKDLIIRYKKEFGFWILKEDRNSWFCALNGFRANLLAVGFKESYGFGYEDLKPYFFKSFKDCMSSIDNISSLEYWEYNRHTHEKVYDTVLRKDKLHQILNEIVKQACSNV